jgi:hypothetical protein
MWLGHGHELLADLPHGKVHGQIPSLLRELADVLKRGGRS